MSLGLRCCTCLIHLIHLLRMKTAFPWHELLSPVESTCVFVVSFHGCSFCVVSELAQLVDELVDLVVPCRLSCVFWDHHDGDHVVVPVDVCRLSG